MTTPLTPPTRRRCLQSLLAMAATVAAGLPGPGQHTALDGDLTDPAAVEAVLAARRRDAEAVGRVFHEIKSTSAALGANRRHLRGMISSDAVVLAVGAVLEQVNPWLDSTPALAE